MDIYKKIFFYILLLCMGLPLLAQETHPLVATFLGFHTWDRIGYWLSPAGDVNGDGLADFIIAQNHFSFSGYQGEDLGSASLILGRPRGAWGLNISLNRATANFVGEKWDAAGWVAVGIGDIDGDGLDDFCVGAADGRAAHTGDGHAYIYFGRLTADWGNTVYLRSYADVTIDGETNRDGFGAGIAGIGDINGDGYDDFIVSAKNNSVGGKIYLFLGKPRSQWSRRITAGSASRVFLCNEPYRRAGYTLAGLGDVNGDGVPDFIVGSLRVDGDYWTSDYGKAFLIFGRRDLSWPQPFNLANADVIFYLEEQTTHAAAFVSRAGDVNGDGFNDILLGGYKQFNERGVAYLVLGKANWHQKTVHLGSGADASWIGENPGDHIAGYLDCLAGGGDINGDGYADILIGAPHYDQGRGRVYVIYGKPAGWSRNVSLQTVSPKISGENPGDGFGSGVTFVGDIDGDGVDDFLISAPHNGQSMLEAGKAYLYLGIKTKVSITGQIRFKGTEKPIEDVRVYLENGTSVDTRSDSVGFYQFLVEGNISCTVTPRETPEMSRYITAYDAALILRYGLNLASFNLSQKIAADVNQDGEINLIDAIQTCRYAVGIPSFGSHAGEAIFSPQSRRYENLKNDLDNQDFEGILLGDVSSLQISLSGKTFQEAGDRIMGPTAFCLFDGEMSLSVILQFIEMRGHHAIEGRIYFDPERFSFQSVDWGGQDPTLSFFNEKQPGLLLLSHINPMGFSPDTLTWRLDFQGNHPDFRLFDCMEMVFQVDESIPVTVRRDYRVSQPTPTNCPLSTRLTPNPTSSVSTLVLELSRSSTVSFEVYDIRGRLLAIWERNFPPGMFREPIRGLEDVGTGIYYCRVVVGMQASTHKIVRIR